MVQIGLLVDTDVAAPGAVEPSAFARHVVECGVTAEAAGFDGVFFPDRHMRATTLAPNQFVNAAAVAARTESVHIGSYCSVLPLYDPMHFAEAWAAVDQLSDGRAVVAIGAGYNDDYLRCFGIPRQDYRRRFVEAGEVLRRAWTHQGPWSYEGQVFRYDDVQLLPGPARAGGPPIWVAGQGPWAVRHAARTGDGFAGDPFPITPEAWKARIGEIRAGAAERGAPEPEIVLLRHVYLTDDADEADAVLADTCLPSFRFYEERGLLDGRLPAGHEVDLQTARDAAVATDAATAARRLAGFVADFEVSYLILKVMRPARLTADAELAMVDELGRHVLEEVRATCSTS